MFPNVIQTDSETFGTSIDPVPFMSFVGQFKSTEDAQRQPKPAEEKVAAIKHSETLPWLKQHLERKALGIKRTADGIAKLPAFVPENPSMQIVV